MLFNFVLSDPTISLRTAAPPMYYISFNPDLYKIEANSSPESTSKPLNITAPYSEAALSIFSLLLIKYSCRSKWLTLPAFYLGLITKGNDFPYTIVDPSNVPICISSVSRSKVPF